MNSSPIRLLLTSAEAVDMLYCSYLTKFPFVQVTVLAKSNYSTLRNEGISMTSFTEPLTSKTIRPHTVWPWDEEGFSSYDGEPFDYVFVSSKSLGKDALNGLERFMSPQKTMLVLFQNGVDVEAPYRNRYPNIPIASAVIQTSIVSNGPSHIKVYPDAMRAIIGLDTKSFHSDRISELDNKLKLLQALSLQGGVKDFVITEDIEVRRWEKVLWNGTYNMTGVLLNMNLGQVCAEAPELIETVMTEIWTVADATIKGNRWFPKSKIQETIEWTEHGVDKSFVPSSVQEIRKGSPVDVEGILGNIVRAAKCAGVSSPIKTPKLSIMYEMILSLNRRLELGEKPAYLHIK